MHVLPASDGWERFHPLTPIFSAWRLIAVGLFFGLQQAPQVATDTPLLLLATVGFAAAAIAGGYGYLAWQYAGFRLTDGQLEIQHGILFKSHGNVPLARIESVDIAQEAVPRAFGLAEVAVEVASQGGGEAELKYLSLTDALHLRTRLDAARRSAAGTAEVESKPPPVPIAVVDDHDLLLAYGFGPVLTAVVVVVASAVIVVMAGVQALLAFGIFGAIAIVTTVVAQLRRVDRLHGFAISRDADEFHISRGFIEKLTQQVPLARIQAIRIEEPWLWRRFGRARLLVAVAGYRGSDRADATAILMPVARRAEIERLVTSFGGPSLVGLSTISPPRSARWRSPWRWRHTRIGHTPGFTVAQRGLLTRRTDFVTAGKLQSLRTTSGPWQRHLGLATLHLDTAGSGVVVTAPHLALDDARRELWAARS